MAEDKQKKEKVSRLLKTIVDHFDQEDRAVRERQLRDCRQLKLLWEGFTRIWYSEVAHDWRVYDVEVANDDSNQEFYDKPINIFRAYLESIIAALSVTVPGIKCYPDDADNPLDLITAKAGDKIALLIKRHNNDPLLFLHALYVLMTEHMVCCYSYPKEDEKYGTYDKNVYEDSEEEAYVCPYCNKNIPDEVFIQRELAEFQPDDDDAALHDLIINQGMKICPECATLLDPNLQKSRLIVTRLVGKTAAPKSRICMEVYGGLYVKVPTSARRQEDIPYLMFSYETHYTNALERYPELRALTSPNGKTGITSGGIWDPYEQWARLNTQYRGEYPINNVTVRNTWLRPCAFEILNDEDAKYLKKEFPDGAKVVMVNELYADSCNESLDDCWTIMQDPMSDFLQKRPMGAQLINVQDITSDIISLVLQTIEHGIAQTFADPQVLNFEAYRQMETLPGAVYPASAKSGKAVSDAFYETRTASLSQEVLPFFQQIQSLGQMAVGALPSLFGGQLDGSKTASEYSMSRAQALQRLQNTWKMFTMWWKEIYSKVIPMYIEEMQGRYEERSVEQDENRNFINVFVRQSELQGKIGRIELEANENLPVTWSQRKDTYMKLLEMQNPLILEALTAPENVKMLAEAIGLDDFTVPGQADIDKQNEEISLLLNSEPILQPPTNEDIIMAMQMGEEPQPIEIPSVEIDFDLDNHQLESQTCRTFLIGPAGRLAKVENPAGYKNILLHMKAHQEAEKMKMMEEMQNQLMAGGVQSEQPEGSNQPLSENENVSTES